MAASGNPLVGVAHAEKFKGIEALSHWGEPPLLLVTPVAVARQSSGTWDANADVRCKGSQGYYPLVAMDSPAQRLVTVSFDESGGHSRNLIHERPFFPMPQ